MKKLFLLFVVALASAQAHAQSFDSQAVALMSVVATFKKFYEPTPAPVRICTLGGETVVTVKGGPAVAVRRVLTTYKVVDRPALSASEWASCGNNDGLDSGL